MIKIKAGDFKKESGMQLGSKGLCVAEGMFSTKVYPLDEIVNIEDVNDQNQKSIGAKMGWGATGAVVLGPLGLLIGALATGNNKRMMGFVIEFADGKRALCECKPQEYQALKQAMF